MFIIRAFRFYQIDAIFEALERLAAEQGALDVPHILSIPQAS